MSSSKKRKNKKNSDFDHREDFDDIRGKGTRREKKKARRHDDKNYLKRFANKDDYDEDDLDNYMNYSQ